MRRNAEMQLDAWGATMPHESYISVIEYLARDKLLEGAHIFPDVFTPVEYSTGSLNSPAAVLSHTLKTPFQHDILPNSQNTPKHSLTRPAVGIRYDGAGAPLPSFGTMMHEQVHIKQYEAAPLFDPLSKEDKYQLTTRREFEAYHLGTLSISSQVAAGFTDVSGADQHQSYVDACRAYYNRNSDDPYRPWPPLMGRIAGIVTDILSTKVQET